MANEIRSDTSKSEYPSESELNTIRGKALVGHATKEEIFQVFGHIDMLEMKLGEADEQDALGTEGWRHFVGMPE